MLSSAPASDNCGSPATPPTLQELNAAKVHHLLDYLDKAAINAIQAAEATNKAATLAAAAAAASSPGSSGGGGTGRDVINGTGSWHSSSLPLGTNGVRRSVSKRDGGGLLSGRESDETEVLGAGTGWESSSQSQNISGNHGGGAHGSLGQELPRPFDTERSVLLSAPSNAQIGLAYHERDLVGLGPTHVSRRSTNRHISVDEGHPRGSSRKKRAPSSTAPTSASTAPVSSDHPTRAGSSLAPFTVLSNPAPNAASQKSIQNVFLELKEKMDRLRYDKDVLQQEKDLLLEQLEASKERERQVRNGYAAQAEEEVKRVQKELHRARKEHKHEMEKLREECGASTAQVEQLSRQLRHELQNREEERKRIEAAHTTALELLQAKYASKERLAREKWREQEAKKIKATTLQSLEPDIVMLLQRHKAEKARMEEDFTRAIRDRERDMATREKSMEERLRQLRQEFEERRESEIAAQQRDESRRLMEEQKKLQRQADDALQAAQQAWESAHRTQIHELQERYSKQQREEREEYEAEMSKLRQEVQRLRTQYSSELLHATQIAHQEEEVKRLHWQEEFVKLTREEISSQCEREAQQKIQEAERALQERLTRERDVAVTTVLNSLQQEHETEEEKRRQERQREKESLLQIQRNMELLRVERDDYRQQLQTCAAERDALQMRCKDASEKVKLYESKEKAREEEAAANAQLQERLLAVELERQQQVLQTQYAQEIALLEAQFKEKERKLQYQQSVLEEEKRSLVQQHHEELRKIQERVVETVQAKEEAMSELQRRAALLEQTLREREEGWAAQQAMLLQA